MPKIKLHCLLALSGFFFMLNTYAKDTSANATAFMTAQDITNDSASNVTMINNTGAAVNVAGLFIASFDINDCSSCFGSVVSGDNLGGAIATPVDVNANQSMPVGQNYLYNMLYNGIYYIKNTVGSSPCSLPGCSWPGDDPNVHGWCITINAASRHSSYTYSNYARASFSAAEMPAYSSAGNSTPFDYKYDLINPMTLGAGAACIGPIVCNDKSMTCQVSTAQHETFQSY